MRNSNPEIGSGNIPQAAEVEPPAFLVPVGGSSEPSVSCAYRDLRRARIRDLLGRWVSGVEPLFFEHVDIAPTVLLAIGIGVARDAGPQFIAEITVDDLSAAMGWIR